MNTIQRVAYVLRKTCNQRNFLHKIFIGKVQKQFFSLCGKKHLQIAFGSTFIPQGKINVEDDLRKAIKEGETALLKLMDQLEKLLIEASKEYRDCLTKQIQLLQKASQSGYDTWDELPKYRTLATELNNELNAYLVVLKTIGQMTRDQTLADNKNSLKSIQKKFNELEVIAKQEFEKNQVKEKELLKATISSILPDKSINK